MVVKYMKTYQKHNKIADGKGHSSVLLPQLAGVAMTADSNIKLHSMLLKF